MGPLAPRRHRRPSRRDETLAGARHPAARRYQVDATARPYIVEVTVLNAGLPGGALDDRSIVLDVLVRLSDGSLVDVEMQSQPRLGAKARALYYWARLACRSPERRPQDPGSRSAGSGIDVVVLPVPGTAVQ